MKARFVDTSITVHLLDEGLRVEVAERGTGAGGLISVQMLNKALTNRIRKARMS